MTTTIEIVLPVFGIILCGFVLARTPLLGEKGIKGINDFVYYVAIPALLFRTLAQGALPTAANLDIVYTYYLATFLFFGLTMLLGRVIFRTSFAERALMGMGAVFSNAVMMGIPLIFTVFGQPGLLSLTLIIAFHSIILMPLAIVFVEIDRGRHAGYARVAPATLLALAKNPVIVSMLAGIVWGVVRLPMPTPLDRFTGLLSDAAAPSALFALGATLAGYRLGGDLAESVTLVALKLLVFPALVWLLATEVFALGPIDVAVATVVAALPVGVNVFILARHYEVYVQRAGTGVLLSTALSVITMAVLLAAFRTRAVTRPRLPMRPLI